MKIKVNKTSKKKALLRASKEKTLLKVCEEKASLKAAKKYFNLSAKESKKQVLSDMCIRDFREKNEYAEAQLHVDIIEFYEKRLRGKVQGAIDNG